jgi:hypothetical protein
MALNILAPQLDSLCQIIIGFTQTSYWALIFISSLITSLLLWRLWRFTVSPMFHPKDAKELPYWIPCKFIFFNKKKDKKPTQIISYGHILIHVYQNSSRPYIHILHGQ